jgi:hypothetical protein
MSATKLPGIATSSRFASVSLFAATTLVATSKTNGCIDFVGTATAIGLVPRRGMAPWAGSTCGPAAVSARPIMSCGRASIAW